MRAFIFFLVICLGIGCMDTKSASKEDKKEALTSETMAKEGVQLVVLGTVQDAGAPHIGCSKKCCEELWSKPDPSLKVVSLGIVDFDNDKTYIVEATPDFPEQLALLNDMAGREQTQMPDGIFITHAHIGHYTGLMFLGREAKGAKKVPVYGMPKFQEFLRTNGPWDQLVRIENIELKSFEKGRAQLSESLTIRPFIVPHRDEYSETVGFVISGTDQDVLFIPDIDKWSKWEEDIIDKVAEVDVAYLDATFFDAKEINNRDIAEIPHPFVIESMELFDDLPRTEKEKINFIHLNHTNPLLKPKSQEFKQVESAHFKVATFMDVVEL